MYKTRQEAERKIQELIELRAKYGKSPVERRIVEKSGQFEIVVIEACRRCGNEVLSRGASEFLLCPSCWQAKRKQDAQDAQNAATCARRRMAAYDDFERVCQ